jgi:hypothetical protein
VRPIACTLARIDYDGGMLGNGVSLSRVKELVALTQRSSTPWLQLEEPEFRNGYNQRPFVVRHRLAEHPLFEYRALAALCRRLPAKQVPYRFGVVPSDTDFDASLQRYRGALTLDDAIEQLEAKQAYIAIYNAETDPEYRPVIEGVLGEIAAHTEPIEPGLNCFAPSGPTSGPTRIASITGCAAGSASRPAPSAASASSTPPRPA